MPSRILAIHICTCVQSLRNGDEGACVVEHLEWEQKSRPEKAGEDSVPRSKSSGRWSSRNARYSPDPNVVRHWMEFLGQRLLFQASCMVPQAFHVDGQRIVAASVGGTQAEDGLDNDSCRGARMANRVDRWDLTQQCLDLQVHPR